MDISVILVPSGEILGFVIRTSSSIPVRSAGVTAAFTATMPSQPDGRRKGKVDDE